MLLYFILYLFNLYYYTSDSLWKIWLVESIQSIHNSLWTWHDKGNICCRYCIYHARPVRRNQKVLLSLKEKISLKPWSNGLASRRKLNTWVYLRLRLGRPCGHLRWLAMTCAHFDRDQIFKQVKPSFSPFGHPTRLNLSWVTSINLLLANEIEDSLTVCFKKFFRLVCTCEETC